MRRAIYYLLQWTWGIAQNLCGLAVFLRFAGRRHFVRYGAVVTVWGENGGCVSLGMFIFMSENCVEGNMTREEAFDKTLVHEFGHTIQSLILGPLYLLVIGLPSIVWAGLPRLRRMRREKRVSYYSFYPERWANHLGEKVTGDRSPGKIV